MPNGYPPGFYTRFTRNMLEFLKHRPDIDLESLDHATEETTYPLDQAHNDIQIHNRSGSHIFIIEATGIAYVRTRKGGAKYQLRVGSISFPFKELYLTNTAQAGKHVSIIIGYEAFIEFTSAHDVMKILNVSDVQVNPATQEKQDSLIGRLDLKPSELESAIRDTKIIDVTDKPVSAGVEYEFVAVTGIGIVIDAFVLSPSTSFSVILTINGIDILDKTYVQYLAISDSIKDIAAFPERDSDGGLTGKYLVCLKNVHFKNHISIKVKNNSGGSITFNNLFCKYKVV